MSLEAERADFESQKAAQTQQRPDVKHVAGLLTRFVTLWEDMTDEEREQAMNLLVERVDIHTKTEGTCRILISDKSRSDKWNLQETIGRVRG